ncbi:MAG: hypothetical protein ABI967_02025 [bacterium]
MTSNYAKNTIGTAFLGFALLLGIGLASTTTANAQRDDPYNRDPNYNNNQQQQRRRNRDWRRGRNNDGRDSDGYGNYGGSFDLRQTALNAGANEGIKAGRKDGSRRKRYDFTDESVYQKATKDYSSRLGDRETYRRYFREAFEHGYADGYNGY